MSKFLVFSDLHLHNWQYGATYSNGWNSRLLAQQNVLNQIVECCEERNINNVFFCGDLFHTHGKVDAACLSIASNFFQKLLHRDIEAVVLIGNHDLVDKEKTINSLRWLGGYSNISLIIKNSYFVCPGMVCAATSYTENKEYLEDILDNTSKDSFVFMHQGVSGIPVGSDFVIPNEILTPDMIPSHVKHAFTGHYHSHKRINDKLTIVGAPMQHTWADSGEDRGWLVVDSETGEYERVLSNAPKFVKISGQTLSHYTKDIPGNYIRIEEDIKENDKEELRKHFMGSGALSVEFAYKNPKKRIICDEQVRDFNLNNVIDKFQKSKNLNERDIKIGQHLREGTYETDIS